MRVFACFIITRILVLFVISATGSALRKVKGDDEVTKASRRSPRKPQPSKNAGLCDMQELVIDLCCVVFVG